MNAEEYQISGPQAAHVHCVAILLAYCARNPDAGMGVAVVGEAAAIEAGRAVAAVAVGVPQHAVGGGDNGRTGRHHLADRRGGTAAHQRRRQGGEHKQDQRAPAGAGASVQVDCH
jgi:hypothetical protein